MKKRESCYTAGGKVNWYSHYGKWYGGSSKKLEVPYDPMIPFLDIFLDRTIIQKINTCTPMFKAVLFTIAKIWKNLSVH